jgi:hypothetical protein
MRRLFTGAAVFLFASFLLASCGGGSSTPVVKPGISVNITASPATIDVTQTANLTATVMNDATAAGVTWMVTGAGSLSAQTASAATYVAPTSGSSAVTATVTATSKADMTKFMSTTITVNPVPSITTTTLPVANVGVAYSGTITATGGTAPYTWSITSGSLPGGLSLGSSTQVSIAVTGDPTTQQTSNFTVQVKDSANLTASTNLSITVNSSSTIPPNQLGTATSATTTCPPSTANPPVSGTCVNLTVTCPNVPVYTPVLLKTTPPSGASKGTVIFTTGGGGNQLYEDQFTFGSTSVNDVVAGGFTAVQTNFVSGTAGWLTGPATDGPLTLACRWATTAQWIHDNILQASTAFCATGNSAGGGAIAYALARYGEDSIFNYAQPTSGPPFSRIDQGCLCLGTMIQSACVGLQDPCYGNNANMFLDPAYGNNHCSSSETSHDMTDVPLWQADSILSSDNKSLFSYSTRIHFIYGDLDTGSGIAEGALYLNAINSQHDFECIADAPHKIADVLDGAQAIANDLINNCH